MIILLLNTTLVHVTNSVVLVKKLFENKSVEKLKKLKNTYRIFGTVFIILSIAIIVYYFIAGGRETAELLVASCIAIGGSGMFNMAKKINIEIVSRKEN